MGKLGLKEFTYVPKKVVKPAAVPKPAAKPVGNHAKKGPATPQQANKNNMPRNSPVTPQNDNNVRNGRIQKKNGNRRGGKNWQQKKKQQNMNVIMNY